MAKIIEVARTQREAEAAEHLKLRKEIEVMLTWQRKKEADRKKVEAEQEAVYAEQSGVDAEGKDKSGLVYCRSQMHREYVRQI